MAAVKATPEQLAHVRALAKANPQAYEKFVSRWAHQGRKELTRNQCWQVVKALGTTRPATTGEPKRVSLEVLDRRRKYKAFLDTLEKKKTFMDL